MISVSFTFTRPVGATASGTFGQQLWFSSHVRQWMVSSFGRCQTAGGRFTLGSLHASGYRRVIIFGQTFYVHRVVAYSFLGLPPDDKTWLVHHRDGNRANNCLDNLEYATQSENSLHSYTTNPGRGRAGSAQSKPVMWRPIDSQLWTTFPSLTLAARQLGMSRNTVARHCRDGTQAGDSVFKFGEQSEPPSLPGEEWVPMLNPTTGLEVPGRQVSSAGRLRSDLGYIFRGHQARSGYCETQIVGKKIFVHRLVARAFLGAPPSPKHSQVNHKDFNRGNNHVDNLEYVTPAQNARHALSNPDIRRRVKEATSKPVLGRPCGEDGWTWYPSILAASEAVGATPYGVSRCIRGLTKHTANYEFKRAQIAEDSPAEELPGKQWRVVDLQGLQEEKHRRFYKA